MFMFDENSMVAKIWADQVRKQNKKVDDVPELYGLREAVKKIVGVTEHEEG